MMEKYSQMLIAREYLKITLIRNGGRGIKLIGEKSSLGYHSGILFLELEERLQM